MLKAVRRDCRFTESSTRRSTSDVARLGDSTQISSRRYSAVCNSPGSIASDQLAHEVAAQGGTFLLWRALDRNRLLLVHDSAPVVITIGCGGMVEEVGQFACAGRGIEVGIGGRG
ncbi:hypothetical protein ACWEO2_06690 [Nocardia sp. NPDC004278]